MGIDAGDGADGAEAGVSSLYLSMLCDPAVGLAVGCKVLRKKLDACGGDTSRGLLAWNGGGNPDYADEVLGRMSRYQ